MKHVIRTIYTIYTNETRFNLKGLYTLMKHVIGTIYLLMKYVIRTLHTNKNCKDYTHKSFMGNTI